MFCQACATFCVLDLTYLASGPLSRVLRVACGTLRDEDSQTSLAPRIVLQLSRQEHKNCDLIITAKRS